MKISLNWIKDYVRPGVSVDQLVQRLTMAGIEAERISKTGKDTVIEFEITPNRPDCLNMVGMAREISAVLNKPLIEPVILSRQKPKDKCDVSILAPEGCLRYIGTVIEGVTVKAADKKIQEKLNILGSRSISNIVDMTNFCLFEIGQPLHAFDLDKLEGKKIIVRFAKKGEKIVTLDGIERELDPSILVIADAKKPVALAGIMGGANSEVSLSTKNILLESAYFDPILIRRTARKLGLASDSSYRFERGVVYDNVAKGSDRAVDLILKDAGGMIARHADVKVGKKPKASATVQLDLDVMNNFLGAKLLPAEVKRILKALGFSAAAIKKNIFKVVPPNFRSDIQRPEDLYEEIARITGYDNLPSSFPIIKVTGMHSNEHRLKRLKISDFLLSQGFNEVLTYSMLSKEFVDNAKVGDVPYMGVLNSLSKEQEIMRPSLLPSLLTVAHLNINRGQKDLAFFEAGKIYPPGGEQESLGMLMTGWLRRDWRDPAPKPFDFFDLKGAIEKMLAQLGIGWAAFHVSDKIFLEKGQRADIVVAKKTVGSAGKVADDVLAAFGIKESKVFFAQIDLEKVYRLPVKKTTYNPICEYPAITRDVSLALSKEATFGDVCRVITDFGSEHLLKVLLKEEYLGDKIEAGKRGLVFSIVYQSSKGTLTEEDVQPQHEKLCEQIVEQLGATIR